MKPALPMNPTGWFQVAWSADLGPGAVLPMRYFGQDLVAYRAAGGAVHILDAYCEHLGAHLGRGGTVSGECIVCPFHGWEWSSEGQNVLVPYQDRPNRARRIRPWPTVERNEMIYLWHDPAGREPFFQPPDIFAEAFPDAVVPASDYYPAHPEGCVERTGIEMHPQYVMENGVDFAHFKYVHRAAEIPHTSWQEWDDLHFHAHLKMTFGGTKERTVLTPEGAVEGGLHSTFVGLGLVYAKFWGADQMRTIVGITPVDEYTSDIRSTVWLERLPDDDSPVLPRSLHRRMKLANNQFLADLEIWRYQRYTDPPALATAEGQGFRALRRWCRRWYDETDALVAEQTVANPT